MLGSVGRDRHLEVNGIIRLKRNRLDAADVGSGAETSRSSVGDLAQQLARKVGIAREIISGVLEAIGISIGQTSGSRAHSSKSGLDGGMSSSTLADKVAKKSIFIAKQIDTISGVEELESKVANKVVLDLVLVGQDITTSSKDGVIRHVGVGRVQHQISGPSIGRIEHVVLDIGSVSVIDIKRVRLELEDREHIRQLDVVDSRSTDIEGSRSSGGKLTRNTESEGLVKTGKSKIHHFIVIILTNIFLCV